MLTIGVQKVCISPPIRTPLGGYIAREGVSSGIHDNLYARAIVLKNKDTALAIISADLIGISEKVVKNVRKLVFDSTGIFPGNILVSTTHTHSGPDLLFGYQGLASNAYHEVLIHALAGAVYGAWLNPQTAELGVNQGWIEGIAVNRRNMENGIVDPQVGVLEAAWGKEQRAILVNYTCHPVVLGPDNLYITADYPGYMLRAVERALEGNVMAIFTNGAAGDINTGHSAELGAIGVPTSGRTYERAEKIGTMLAGEVIKVAEAMELKTETSLASHSKMVSLPLKSLPSKEVLEELLKTKKQHLQTMTKQGVPHETIAQTKIAKVYVELLLNQAKKTQASSSSGAVAVEIQVMRMGECAFVSFPGEMFVEIGLAIKKLSPFRHTYIIGYANGYQGYLLTKKAFSEGGYEAVVTNFAPESAEIIEKESVELLQSLY